MVPYMGQERILLKTLVFLRPSQWNKGGRGGIIILLPYTFWQRVEEAEKEEEGGGGFSNYIPSQTPPPHTLCARCLALYRANISPHHS